MQLPEKQRAGGRDGVVMAGTMIAGTVEAGPVKAGIVKAGIVVVRMKGLEPSRVLPHSDLNAARLPIPPHPHV